MPIRIWTTLGFVIVSCCVAPRAQAAIVVGQVTPSNNATVTTPRPQFSVDAPGLDPNSHIFITVSDHWQAPNGVLGSRLPLGGLLQLDAASPTSSTFSGSEFVDLSPGTYYWQWKIYTAGCATVVDPKTISFVQPDCAMASDVKCDFNGTCVSPVYTLTVTKAAPLPPPTTPSGSDTKPPAISAKPARGRVHQPIRLAFVVEDDSQIATVYLGVFRGATKVAAWSAKLKAPMDAHYYQPWKPTARGTYDFCAVAVDPSGDKSKVSCKPVVVR